MNGIESTRDAERRALIASVVHVLEAPGAIIDVLSEAGGREEAKARLGERFRLSAQAADMLLSMRLEQLLPDSVAALRADGGQTQSPPA